MLRKRRFVSGHDFSRAVEAANLARALAPAEMPAAKFEIQVWRRHWRSARNTGEFEMEVILKEDVVNLGNRGDVVKVADGYGRNFLLPRKLALQATTANKSVVDQMKNAAARRSATEKALAEELVIKLAPIVLSFTRKSGEAGHLFGSVTSSDIAAELEAKGFSVDRRKIQLDEPIKSLGDFSVAIKLYRDVTGHVKVTVLAEATAEGATESTAEAAPEVATEAPAAEPATEPAAEAVVSE